jgi:hypothetical protein
MKVGETRDKFCEYCEDVTRQRLDFLRVLPSGSTEIWHCINGDHRVGEYPKPVPPLKRV